MRKNIVCTLLCLVVVSACRGTAPVEELRVAGEKQAPGAGAAPASPVLPPAGPGAVAAAIPVFRTVPKTVVPVFQSVTENTNEVFAHLPGPEIARVPDGTVAERLASFNHGFEADSLAEQLRFADGSTGWVDYRKVFEFFRLVEPAAFRLRMPAAGPPAAILPAGTVLALYTYPFAYKGVDPGDGIPVRLADGRHGYLVAGPGHEPDGIPARIDTPLRLVAKPLPAFFVAGPP